MRTAIAQAADRLAAAGVPSPRVDAVALAEHALGVPQLILAVPPPVPAGFEGAYETLVRRREAREPLQHIVGYATFRRLSVRVGPGVFVPRPETEVVAQQAIGEATRLLGAGRSPMVGAGKGQRAPVVVVDLCTGSGAIALSVAVEAPGSRVVAVDVDPAAVALAQVNADRLIVASTTPRPEPSGAADRPGAASSGTETEPGATPSAAGSKPDGSPTGVGSGVGSGGMGSDMGANSSAAGGGVGSDRIGGIRFEVGDVADPDLLSEFTGAVDVVISNPPYIPDDAVPLEPEVADHDPPRALFGGGTDGLDVPRQVVAAAVRLLGAGGLFVMEHADVQGSAVRDLVDRTGAFEPATTHRDLTGRDRYVRARRRST